MNTASSLFALHQLELMTKPSDDEEIVITTDKEDIVAEIVKPKSNKSNSKKAKNVGGNKNEK